MQRKIWLELTALLLTALILWGALYYFRVFPENNPVSVPIAKEEKLGSIILDNIKAQHKEIRTPALDSAVYLIKNRLLRGIETTEYEYEIIVVKNSQINAFALPGGKIVIFSGLIDFAGQPEEVVAVLAHEIGHVEHKHVIERLVKELGLSILFSAFGGDVVIVHEITRTLISNTFNRVQEEEADQFALDLMLKSGTNPRIMATFFRRLNEKSGSYAKELEFMSTHPHNNSRIKSALEYTIPENFSALEYPIDWKKLKKSLEE